MKVTDFKRNTSMLLNLTKCAGCLQRVVNLNKFVRFNSHYAALGLPPNATQKEIRDAYIKLSKEHHPDKTNQQDKASHEKFVKINTAYEVLSKETSKREYDLDLTMQNQPGKTYTGSYSTYRPPHYNPYAKEQPKDDPFSFYNYETYQRQRARIRRMHGLERRIKIRWENKKPEDIIIHFLMFTFILVNLNILFEDKPPKVRPAIFPEDVDLLARPIKRNHRSENPGEFTSRVEMEARLQKARGKLLLYLTAYFVLYLIMMFSCVIYVEMHRYKRKLRSESPEEYRSRIGDEARLKKLKRKLHLFLIAYFLFYFASTFTNVMYAKLIRPLRKFQNSEEYRHRIQEEAGIEKIHLWLLLFVTVSFILHVMIMVSNFVNLALNRFRSKRSTTSSRPVYRNRAERDAKLEEQTKLLIGCFLAFFGFFVALMVANVIFVDMPIIRRHTGTEEKVERRELTIGDYEEYFYYFMLYSLITLAVYNAAKFVWVYGKQALLQNKLKKTEAEAWESGSASYRKAFLYFGFYVTIAYILGKEEVARRMEMRKKQGYSVTKVEKNQNNEDNKSDMKNLSPKNKNQVNRQNIDNKNEVKNQSSEKVSNLKNQILSMKSDVKNLSLDDSSVKNMRESLKERSDVKNQSNNDLQSKKESIRRIRDLNLNKSLDSEIDVKMAESIKV